MPISNNHDFNALAKEQKSIRMKLRFLALAHFQEGHSRYAIAQFLKVSRTSVTKWISQYHKLGLEGLIDKKTTGRPNRLSEQQLQKLYSYVSEQAKNAKGGRLVGTDIQRYVLKEFGVKYHLSQIYKILKKIGLSWITSRSKHPKQSVEAQEDFKKIQNKNDP